MGSSSPIAARRVLSLWHISALRDITLRFERVPSESNIADLNRRDIPLLSMFAMRNHPPQSALYCVGFFAPFSGNGSTILPSPRKMYLVNYKL